MVSAAADRGIFYLTTTIFLRLCVFARRKKYGAQRRKDAKASGRQEASESREARDLPAAGRLNTFRSDKIFVPKRD